MTMRSALENTGEQATGLLSRRFAHQERRTESLLDTPLLYTGEADVVAGAATDGPGSVQIVLRKPVVRMVLHLHGSESTTGVTWPHGL